MITRNNQGFTLLEIVVAVALVAILAGSIAPFAIKRLDKARAETTSLELERINNALLDFCDDLGRFPTQGEGLTVLASSTGLSGQDLARWRGPYVSGGNDDLITNLCQDSFGSSYVYVAAPTVNPATAADVVVSSLGVDKTQQMPDSGSTWVVANANLYDDLVIFVSRSSLVRQKKLDTLTELEALADAAREYYEDNSAFPATLALLSGTYIDPGFEDDAFNDEWETAYALSVSGATPPVATIWSYGPDQTNDSGGDDDLVLVVNGQAIENVVVVDNTDGIKQPTGPLATDQNTFSTRLFFPAARGLSLCSAGNISLRARETLEVPG